MVTEKVNIPEKIENPTPSLSVTEILEDAKKHLKKDKKLGVNDGKPYWQPVKGIIRWELRQHYRDSKGIRQTRVLETRKRKPREIKV
jgi:hypothetical protein